MKRFVYFPLAFIALTFSRCKAESTIPLYVKDFKFNGYFGNTQKDTNTNYCLLGQGFFRTEHATNAEAVISIWIQSHPNAQVIKVASMATPDERNKALNLSYCWLIDGNDTLNNELIKQGCYPAGTMQRPPTWNEMTREEKSFYEGTEKPDIKVYVDATTYEHFIQQIKAADQYAQGHKLGIWAVDKKGH